MLAKMCTRVTHKSTSKRPAPHPWLVDGFLPSPVSSKALHTPLKAASAPTMRERAAGECLSGQPQCMTCALTNKVPCGRAGGRQVCEQGV